jgi:hypothetical protein
MAHVVMLDEFSASTHADSKRAKHTLALTKIWLSILLVLDVHVESLTLKEDFEVAIMLEYRMSGNLVEHALQGSSSRLHEVGIKSAHRLLLGRRRHNHAGVVTVQGVIEP